MKFRRRSSAGSMPSAVSREVDDPLEQEGRFRTPRAAVGIDRHVWVKTALVST
jgi:hypothetical protein